jgi:hypothetical protein
MRALWAKLSGEIRPRQEGITVTTIPLSATSERTTEPICPSWCPRHNDEGYQGWENTEDGPRLRDHCESFHLTTKAGVEVSIDLVASEREGTGVLKTPKIGLYVDRGDVDLTLWEATDLVCLLVDAVALGLGPSEEDEA